MEKNVLEVDDLYGKYLTFTLGEEDYGISIGFVKEIIGIQKITPVPKIPEYIKGIINLRGLVIPVMDVRLRLGQSFREYDDRSCIIVVETKGHLVGLIVDSVSEVLTVDDKDISEIPDGLTQNYIMGIGKTSIGVILLIDCNKLLLNDLDIISNI